MFSLYMAFVVLYQSVPMVKRVKMAITVGTASRREIKEKSLFTLYRNLLLKIFPLTI